MFGWELVFVSEIDPDACWVLHHRYGAGRPIYMPDPNEAGIDADEKRSRAAAIKAVAGIPEQGRIPNYGDFTKIPEGAGPIDLLVGGTPCQSFSIAGKRLGLDDPRGNLAIEFCRLARRLNAMWVVWENVPGVLSNNGGRDFAAFLWLMGQCGYGWAYRVLDAQYIRTHGFERAVPQRRRRVIVVGHLGDWRDSAAVLLEPNSMRGDTAPSRKALAGTARPFESGPSGGRFSDVAPTLDTGCSNRPMQNQIGVGVIHQTAHRMVAFGEYEDDGSASTIKARDHKDATDLVAHTLTAAGFDASEDGTGRGTPLVPVAFAENQRSEVRLMAVSGALSTVRRGDAKNETLLLQPQAPVAFDSKGTQVAVGIDGNTPTLRTMNSNEGRHNGGGQMAVAYSMMPMNSGKDFKARVVDVAQPVLASGQTLGNQGGDVVVQPQAYTIHGTDKTASVMTETDVAGTLRTKPPGSIENSSTTAVLQRLAVRRLTPKECERLQGFPDDFTQGPRGNKPMPDGSRYRMIGNSMAVNVMRWVGHRIDLMNKARAV